MSAENALRLQVEYLTMAVDDEREKAARLERERDALAAQLAALTDVLRGLAVCRHPDPVVQGRGVHKRKVGEKPCGRCVPCVANRSLANGIEAAAEAYTQRVQAEARSAALEEARAAIEMAFGSDEDVSAQEVIDRLLDADRAAEIRGGR